MWQQCDSVVKVGAKSIECLDRLTDSIVSLTGTLLRRVHRSQSERGRGGIAVPHRARVAADSRVQMSGTGC